MNTPVIGRLQWPRRRQATPEETAAQAQERLDRQERARLADTQRREDAARRRQVAGELAASALAWGLNGWLEGAMWFCLFGGLVVLYIGSYADLAATFAAFGYDRHISWLLPLGIDLPVTASVLAQMLAGRWKCGWSVHARLGLLTAVTAPLTLTGNALRGAIDANGHFAFHVDLWMDLVAFAVPGLGVVLIGYVASMMQGERAELMKRRLEAEADRGAVEPSADDDTDEPHAENPTDREGEERDQERADGESGTVRNPQPHQPARVEVRRQLGRHRGALEEAELRRLAVRVHERTGVSIPRARRLIREEQQPRLVTGEPQQTRTGAGSEA
jgi:hypothetical protein